MRRIICSAAPAAPATEVTDETLDALVLLLEQHEVDGWSIDVIVSELSSLSSFTSYDIQAALDDYARSLGLDLEDLENAYDFNANVATSVFSELRELCRK